MIFKKILREELIRSKIEKIKDSLNFISENLPDNYEDFIKSRVLFSAIYKEIEQAIELVLDIFSIINADLRLGFPQTEDNILDSIEKKGIFDKKIMNLVREIKRFRNFLVHRYEDTNHQKAYEDITEGLKDFEIIINKIEKFLEKHKPKGKKK